MAEEKRVSRPKTDLAPVRSDLARRHAVTLAYSLLSMAKHHLSGSLTPTLKLWHGLDPFGRHPVLMVIFWLVLAPALGMQGILLHS